MSEEIYLGNINLVLHIISVLERLEIITSNMPALITDLKNWTINPILRPRLAVVSEKLLSLTS